MFDPKGYRLNVGIVLSNTKGRLFWGKRVKANGWQFPQGGVQPYETLEETMYRELAEEVGLSYGDVAVLSVTKRWLRYTLPISFRRRNCDTICVGQKQKWFSLLLTCSDSKIDLKLAKKPEFLDWRWIDYWEPIKHVVYFKQYVYAKVLAEFENIIKSKIV